MEKCEHVITLSIGTKERVDQAIYCHKASIAKDILKELFVSGGIDAVVYENKLKSLYSYLGFGDIR